MSRQSRKYFSTKITIFTQKSYLFILRRFSCPPKVSLYWYLRAQEQNCCALHFNFWWKWICGNKKEIVNLPAELLLLCVVKKSWLRNVMALAIITIPGEKTNHSRKEQVQGRTLITHSEGSSSFPWKKTSCEASKKSSKAIVRLASGRVDQEDI